MQGFPPAPDARVTLANWQTPPYNRWAFSHLREIVPTQRIARGDGPVLPLPADPQPVGEVETVRRTARAPAWTPSSTTPSRTAWSSCRTAGWLRALPRPDHGGHHAPAHVDLEVGRQLRRGQPRRPRGALARAARDRHVPEMLSGGYRGRDGAPPAGHAVGHPLRARSTPTRTPRCASSSRRPGGARWSRRPARVHVPLPRHAGAAREHGARSSTAPARRTCWAGSASGPRGGGWRT